MDIRLLGPIETSLDSGPAALGPRQQRAVLAMLALELNRTVSTDRLIEGLWGERAPPSAPKLVQLYVSQLRKLLGEEAEIVTRGRGYELRLAADRVDAARFECLVAEAADGQRPGRCGWRARRSRCGAGRRWPTSPMSRSPARRSAGWTSCGCARPSSRSTASWPRVGIAS